MKKNFMVLAAVMMGILVAFASCKDNKASGGNNNATEEEETVQKLTKITSAEDLDDLDIDDLDLSDLESLDALEGLDDLNFDELTEKQANTLLAIMAEVANKELPSDEGDGVKLNELSIEGDDVNFCIEMGKEALQGVPISMFDMIFNSPEMKEAMMGEMVNGMTSGDDDMGALFKVIIAAKKNFCMKFVDAGESAVCRLEGKEMAKLLKASKEEE